MHRSTSDDEYNVVKGDGSWIIHMSRYRSNNPTTVVRVGSDWKQSVSLSE